MVTRVNYILRTLPNVFSFAILMHALEGPGSLFQYNGNLIKKNEMKAMINKFMQCLIFNNQKILIYNITGLRIFSTNQI